MQDQWYYKVRPEYLAYLGSKAWKDRRARVIERCNNACERCGKFAVTEVHHLTYARIYHEELEDLQGVCSYCHDFLHRKSPDDGTAEYARLEKQWEETRARVASGRGELQRLDASPHLYRHYAEGPLPEHRELVRLFREHSRVIDADREERIVDPKIAKRKYETAVAFKLQWDTAEGYAWTRVPSAEEWLRRGVVFDTERGVWVNVAGIRDFIRWKERV